MDKADAGAEGGFENLDELAGEGDFGDEEDDGLTVFKGILGHFEIDVGFTATSNAMEEFCVSWSLIESF